MLKSLRRAKDAVTGGPGSTAAGAPAGNAAAAGTAIAAKTGSGSTMSLANGIAGEGGFVPGKTLLKPADQLALTDKELEEELTRILNANNPHAAQNYSRYNAKERAYKTQLNTDHLIVHFEYEGHLIYKGGDESRRLAAAEEDAKNQAAQQEQQAQSDAAVGGDAEAEAEGEVAGKSAEDGPKKPTVTRNQFNYSERAAQTINLPLRERSTNTEPPPHKTYSGSVTQWSIFDAYLEDQQLKEKSAKEKSKTAKKEESTTGLGGAAFASQNSLVVSTGESQPPHEEYKHTADVKKVASILERMCNQNTFDEVTHDFKYWNDAADEFREGKGVLLPLWKFYFEKDRRKQVTSLAWNPNRSLFGVGFGSYDFTKQGPGIFACFSLKNPTYPEFVYRTDSGVMCLDFHKDKPSLVVVGMYDGTVAVFDLSKKRDTPLFRSSAKGGKHTDPVWQVSWQRDDLDEHANFVSVSSDGRVTLWTLLKTELAFTDIIKLRVEGSSKTPKVDSGDAADGLFELSGGSCFDFSKTNPDVFIVGTEDGKIHKCSRAYNSQYMLTYEGHQMGVYALKYSPFMPTVFLSASADWTVKLWEEDCSTPLLTFDLNSSVGDIAWSPYSSTVFSAVTADGKVFVYDINENKYEPLCEQQVIKKAKLTHVAFNPTHPIILVGDDRGQCMSFKVSPNLRKIVGRETQEEKLARIVNGALGRDSADAQPATR